MATSSEVLKHMIHPLEAYLGEPKHANPEGFYDVIYEVLEDFTPYQLDCAVKLIKRTWKYRTWPSAAEMADKCRCFAAQEMPSDGRKRYAEFEAKREAASKLLTSAETMARLKGPIAVDAARDGWAKALFDYVREHGELPFPEDENRVKTSADRTRRQQEAVLNGEVITPDGEVVKAKGPLVSAVQALAVAMREREARIAADILNANMETV